MSGNYVSCFSWMRKAWSVFLKCGDDTHTYLYRCPNKKDAALLARALNDGAKVCKGSHTLKTACNKCVKCNLTK